MAVEGERAERHSRHHAAAGVLGAHPAPATARPEPVLLQVIASP
ncbi:hypothetical protein [Actinosynnema sp. NPDC023587]